LKIKMQILNSWLFFFWKFGAFSFYSASTPTETHGFFLENENADILN
jgi:hypothetical protein